MTIRSAVSILRGAAVAVLLPLLTGCGPRTHVAGVPRSGESNFDVITSFLIRDGQALNRQETPLPPGAYRFGFFARPSPGLRPVAGAGTRSKLHSALLRRMMLGPPGTTEDVVVTFADTVRIPRFPNVSGWQTLADSSSKGTGARNMIDSLRIARAPERAADESTMVTQFGAVILDNTFWLTRSLVIRIPRNRLAALAASSGVLNVRPAGPTEPPPGMNTSEKDDPDIVRWWLGADAYYVDELQRGTLALLDTGVRSHHPVSHTAHRMFRESSQFGQRADLVYPSGNSTLPAYPDDISPGPGHGTMSAGIINGRLKETELKYWDSRGLTKLAIDSYLIYSVPASASNPTPPPEPGLEGGTLQHALESTFLSFGGVIVVEAQAEDDHNSGISLAADGAFDGGAVVVAANGNVDVGGSDIFVRAPANARKALGIGAYSVRSGISAVEQIPGPADDLRTKPDLQAPTGYETASKPSDESYSGHSGTSGATAVAGGAAALFRNLLADEYESVDPGYVYAGLIASATKPWAYDKNVNGGGWLRLPNNSWCWTMKLSLSNDEHFEHVFDTSGLSMSRVAAGIWWPERAKVVDGVEMETHSDITLTLKAADANASPSGTSNDKESVFQRVAFQVASPVSGLTVRAHARTVPDGPQTVYLVVLAYQAATP